mmetsp:Transcript_11886/g.31270  ORF Transcript_11886/g.31270 Transcript_11886/m.31270 type:complete len:449 (+) Transcript_11886:73-1419(+)
MQIVQRLEHQLLRLVPGVRDLVERVHPPSVVRLEVPHVVLSADVAVPPPQHCCASGVHGSGATPMVSPPTTRVAERQVVVAACVVLPHQVDNVAEGVELQRTTKVRVVPDVGNNVADLDVGPIDTVAPGVEELFRACETLRRVQLGQPREAPAPAAALEAPPALRPAVATEARLVLRVLHLCAPTRNCFAIVLPTVFIQVEIARRVADNKTHVQARECASPNAGRPVRNHARRQQPARHCVAVHRLAASRVPEDHDLRQQGEPGLVAREPKHLIEHLEARDHAGGPVIRVPSTAPVAPRPAAIPPEVPGIVIVFVLLELWHKDEGVVPPKAAFLNDAIQVAKVFLCVPAGSVGKQDQRFGRAGRVSRLSEVSGAPVSEIGFVAERQALHPHPRGLNRRVDCRRGGRQGCGLRIIIRILQTRPRLLVLDAPRVAEIHTDMVHPTFLPRR